MCEFEKVLVAGEDFQEFSKSLTNAIQALPIEQSMRLRTIRHNYFAWHGIDGAFTRMNHRTVGEIFAQYRPEENKPIASGRIDNVEYELHGSPPAAEHKNSQQSPE